MNDEKETGIHLNLIFIPRFTTIPRKKMFSPNQENLLPLVEVRKEV